ncbi:2-oxo-4-hydroxy-4-carboxy-5-ureidoimidazoline decarboxylase [Acinetobacter sp. WZC-1]|uniref:2-oxo-4-hydroxy-4-carboxy-5-ureidoimidazoline decarboxylase n=1 Tax=Acinetobacter sp. WZC-1 TaxID=3459034 RepID=UPI00403D72E8
MQLAEFNQATVSDIHDLLRNCVNIEHWVRAIQQQRPFASLAELMDFAKLQAQGWHWSDIDVALSNHPRIGEKKASSSLSSKEQIFSAQEQAAISQDQNTRQAIEQGNLVYERKFGFIFLIRAAGLNANDILTTLHYRLNNDPETERQIVHQQLMDIALFRLAQEIQP